MPKLFGACVGGKGGKKRKGKKGKKIAKAPSGVKIDETDGGFGPWDNIVEKSMVGTGIMTDGAIVDKDGKIYGINDDFKLTKKQIKLIAEAIFVDPDKTGIPEKGISVGNKHFKYDRCEHGDKMFGSKDDTGIIIAASKNFMIIGIYEGKQKEAMSKEMMVDLQRYFTGQGI